MVSKCKNCGKEIQDDRNFRPHVERCVFNHRKTLTCPNCDKRYSYRSSMYLHQRNCKGVARSVAQQASHNTTYPKMLNEKRRKKHSSKEQVDFPNNLENGKAKYKYVINLRTKTCSVIQDDDDDVKGTDDQYVKDDVCKQKPAVKIEEEYSDQNEVEIIELPEVDCEDFKREEDDFVILEDFGYFNKVKLCNGKTNTDEN